MKVVKYEIVKDTEYRDIKNGGKYIIKNFLD